MRKNQLSGTERYFFSKTQDRKLETNIPRTGIARTQSLFPHSCVCERLIYSHDRSAYSDAGKYVNRSWEYINRSQTHECGNWDRGHAIPFLGIFVSNFRYCSFAVWSVLDVAFYSLFYNNCSSSIKKTTRFWNKLSETCFTTLSMLFTWNNISFGGVI